jgi:hypothetical protein
VDDEAVEDPGLLVAEHLVDLAHLLVVAVVYRPARLDQKPGDGVAAHP